MTHVPYRRRRTAITDLIGGPGGGLLRRRAAIGRADQSRQAARARSDDCDLAGRPMPDVPTVAEFVPGYAASGWDRHGRAARNSRRHRQQAQPRDQLLPLPIPN